MLPTGTHTFDPSNGDAMSGQRGKLPLLGREEELATILARLEESEAGRGSLVLIGGEPGIGKSRLADEVAAHARDRGFASLWGRGWEDAGAPPYWPWVQVLRSYLRQADAEVARRRLATGAADIVQMLPELRDLIPDLPETARPDSDAARPDSDAARFQLFDSTVGFLRGAALDRPLLVVLDDLQAADPSSLRLLQFLAVQLVDMRAVVVGTYRDIELTPDHPLTPALAEMAREPATRVISLRGLDPEALRQLIGASAGVAVSEPLVAAVTRSTKGNPLFVTEALRLLSAEGRLDEVALGTSAHVAVPAGVRAVIGRRLEHLAPATTSALTVGAVVGPEFDAALLDHIGERDHEAAEAGIDEAVREGLLLEVIGAPGRYRFSHDLVRETLYDELPPGRRRGLHRVLAEHLERLHAADPESHLAEIAYHFYEGERDASVDAKTVDYARRAGQQASRSLAFEEAARLYRLAAAALERSSEPDPATRLDILLALGDTLNRGGDVPEARTALMEATQIATSLGASRELAQAALSIGGRLPWARPGRDTRLVPLLQDALVHLGGSDDGLRVRLLSRLACALRSTPDQRGQSDALSRQAVELARSLGDPDALSYALAGRFWAIWGPDNSAERLTIAQEMSEIADRLGDGERLIDAQLMLWLIHTEMSDMTAARRAYGEMLRLVTELRQPGHLWLGIANGALLALLEGDFAAAEALIDEETDPGAYFTLAHDNVSAARCHLFLLRREQGRLAEEEANVRLSVDEFPWYPLHRSALACLLVELERDGEAQGVLDELGQDDFKALYPDNEWLLGTGLAAEAAARLGDRDAAETLYQQLAPLAGRHAIGHTEGSIGAVDRYLGLLAATLDRLDDAARHLEDAVHLNERMGARPWTAHSRHDLADVLRARHAPGDAQRAVDLDALGLAAARDLGMTALGARILATETDAADAASGPATGTFRREGEYWTIAYEGESVRLKHSKGLGYLSRLLERPGTEIHAVDLASVGVNGATPAVLAELSIGADAGAGPALDDAARSAYRERIEDLRADIAQAEEWNDSERASIAQTELDALTAQLASAVGLGGRDRPTSSTSERARISVTRAIRNALERLSGESPALGRHLEATVRTGTYCSYTPDPRAPITWQR
ncbi:MAG TPA: AAA family ATPase [Candidatus Limnocylindria bacterium]